MQPGLVPQFNPSDPNALAALQQYLQQLAAQGQLPGYTLTKDPEPVAPLTAGELLHTLAARIPWHNEDQHNQVHAGIDAFVSRLESLEQDLAAIRARIGVYTQPVTPVQAGVAAAHNQPIPAPLVTTTAVPFAPPLAFGPAGVPVPPAPPAPPAFPGMFNPATGAPIVPPGGLQG